MIIAADFHQILQISGYIKEVLVVVLAQTCTHSFLQTATVLPSESKVTSPTDSRVPDNWTQQSLLSLSLRLAASWLGAIPQITVPAALTEAVKLAARVGVDGQTVASHGTTELSNADDNIADFQPSQASFGFWRRPFGFQHDLNLNYNYIMSIVIITYILEKCHTIQLILNMSSQWSSEIVMNHKEKRLSLSQRQKFQKCESYHLTPSLSQCAKDKYCVHSQLLQTRVYTEKIPFITYFYNQHFVF